MLVLEAEFRVLEVHGKYILLENRIIIPVLGITGSGVLYVSRVQHEVLRSKQKFIL